MLKLKCLKPLKPYQTNPILSPIGFHLKAALSDFRPNCFNIITTINLYIVGIYCRVIFLLASARESKYSWPRFLYCNLALSFGS